MTNGSDETATQAMSGRKKAGVVVRAALEKAARDPVCLDVRDVVSFADVLVILSGRSDRQVRAIADAVEEAVHREGERTLGVEGYDEGRWVLIDLSDVIVHVFQEEVRAHYDLERLWSDARALDPKALEGESGPAGAARTVVR